MVTDQCLLLLGFECDINRKHSLKAAPQDRSVAQPSTAQHMKWLDTIVKTVRAHCATRPCAMRDLGCAAYCRPNNLCSNQRPRPTHPTLNYQSPRTDRVHVSSHCTARHRRQSCLAAKQAKQTEDTPWLLPRGWGRLCWLLWRLWS